MNTLVYHPHDRTTTFLKPIYKKVVDPTIRTEGFLRKTIQEECMAHDRVLAMGHGTPSGLINTDRSGDVNYIIHHDLRYVLREQLENVYIWCNADKFVEENDLRGFYSGMFISEVMEAIMMGLRGITQEMVDESNDRFAEIVGYHINKPCELLYDAVKREYKEVASHNLVALYNWERLYFR